MDFEIPKSRVYILLDEDNNIIRIEGEYSLPEDLTGWIKIDEGYGDKCNHAQNHYLKKPIINFESGSYNYKYVDGKIIEQ